MDRTRTSIQETRVQIPAGNVRLDGDLRMPAAPRGAVLFAHGSGRHRPRNRAVAVALNENGLATFSAGKRCSPAPGSRSAPWRYGTHKEDRWLHNERLTKPTFGGE
jgi:hypothetical protein